MQAVINSPQRKLALIDGKLVPLGGEAREGTVVGLTDSTAVLRKEGRPDVLLMHPGIEKKPASNPERKQP